MGFCIRRIALLEIKSIFFFIFKISLLFQFEIAFSDIWIFLIPRVGGGGGLEIHLKPILVLIVVSRQHGSANVDRTNK